VSDVFSLGVATYELLAGHAERPFNSGPVTHSYAKQAALISKAGAPRPLQRAEPLSTEGQEFLSKVLECSPVERFSAAAALEHPWFHERDTRHATSSDNFEHLRLSEADENVIAYSRHNSLERVALDAISYNLAPAAVVAMRDAFVQVDKDGSGTISRDELRQVLSKHGEHTEETLDHVFAKLDPAGTGEIAYTEYLATLVAANLKKLIRTDSSAIRMAFDALDLDGSGTISASEIEKLVGHELSERTSQQFHKVAGADDNIDYEEFKRMVRSMSEEGEQEGA